MKLSELIKQNADKYQQAKNTIYAGEENGKREVCVLGLCGFELFPDTMEQIVNVEHDDYDEGGATGEVQSRVLAHFGITYGEMLECTDGAGMTGLNDTFGLSFIEIADKFEACGL